MKRKIYLIFILTVVLSGCAPWIRGDQPATGTEPYPLRASLPLGQTLTARHAGLQGIKVFLAPGNTTEGELLFRLSPAPGSPDVIAFSRLEIRQVTQPGFYSFTFPSIDRSQAQPYFLQLEIDGPGEIEVGLGPGESYLDGALYVGGEPKDAQLAFQTLYNPAWLALGQARLGLTWLRVLFLTLWLYLIPGLAALARLFPRKGSLSWMERAIIGTGLGLAGYPILFLLTDLAGLHPGRLLAWAPPVIGAIYLLWHSRAWLQRPRSVWLRVWGKPADRIPEVAALLVFGLLLASRFYPVAGLAAPMWGDSYQHSMITQLMFDNGGLFDSWQPYADMTAFTYHFGFHSLAAVFGWVSGDTSWQAVLWTGQILNLLAVVGLYPLALRLSNSRWGGLVAIVVAGALAPMPMAYINWGRYTQLAGQAILPAAVFLAWYALESQKLDWRLSGLGWIAWAGLALTHYRVLVFGVLFILAYLAFRLWRPDRVAVLLRLLALASGAVILFIPWFLHIFAGRIMDMLLSQLTTPPSNQSVWAQNNLFSFTILDDYLPYVVWALAGLSVIWAIARKKREVLVIALWSALVLLAANPDWLRLPGEGALSNFAVFIAAYIPAALLIGGVFGTGIRVWLGGQERTLRSFSPEDEPERNLLAATMQTEDVENRSPDKWSSPKRGSAGRKSTNRRALTAAILVLVVCGWGVRNRIRDVNPYYGSLVTQPDIRAVQWIREHIPPDARFHVNQFFAFSDSVTVGADAGWWLPLLARRATDLPPINYGFEQTSKPNYREWVNALPALIQEKGIDHPDVLAAFQERGITHLYIGQRQGRVNYNGPDVLAPDMLLASQAFNPVYHQDRVWIFEIVP